MGVFPCAQLYKSGGFGHWSEVAELHCTTDGWLSGGPNGLTYNIVSQTVGGLNDASMVKVGFWGTPGGAPYGYYGDIESPVASVW